ncbi:MAG: integrase/recombinase XerD [Mucilaginibacter sp.]|nr:integrase/recombinase XerD [Mucilaginibacter sp.]
MSECTVQLWYNKQRPKKNGTVSLYIQLIVGEEHDQVPINNLNWPVNKIDWNKKQLLQRYPDDQELTTYNAIIERERAKYWKVVMGFLKRGQEFTIADIYREVNQYKGGHLICAYMQYAIRYRQKSEKKKERIKASTARPHTTSLNWLKGYLNGADIEIIAIDGNWLEKYADYLRKHMCENTVWVRIKDIKTYINFAYENRIDVNLNYKKFAIAPEETNPTWLEENELNLLLDLYWNPDTAPNDRRNLRAFLFSCFTGLRISDLSRWNKDWIDGDEIVFVPTKRRWTKKEPKPLRIPIIPIAWEFINDLQADTLGIHSDQAYNRELKPLSGLAGFKKVLTSHVGRHTFATWLAIDGVPVLVISKLLGHKSTAPTMVYIHIAEAFKAREMMKLQRRFGSRKPGQPPPDAIP